VLFKVRKSPKELLIEIAFFPIVFGVTAALVLLFVFTGFFGLSGTHSIVIAVSMLMICVVGVFSGTALWLILIGMCAEQKDLVKFEETYSKIRVFPIIDSQYKNMYSFFKGRMPINNSAKNESL